MGETITTTTEIYSPGVDLDEVYQTERPTILVVEDDFDSIFLLKQILRRAGFNVLSAAGGREALRKCSENQPNLVLLDVMMPEMDGFETLHYVRKISSVPVIIVSALATKDNVVRALNSGVDDYITKPFFNEEVVARIRAVLRRASEPQEISRLVFPQVELVVDLHSQEVTIKDVKIQLTSKEFAVLSVLAKHAPAIVSYSAMAQAVWGADIPEVRKRTKYLIYLLRRKLEEAAPEGDLILNVGRLGYKLQTER